jgi:transposase
VWLSKRTDRTSVATLVRCSRDTVTAIINLGVAELPATANCRVSTLFAAGRCGIY